MLRDLLRKRDFMVKIGLKDAYFTVPIWKNHQKYLRFVWKETIYEFACLPFGISSAPRAFTKLMKPVVGLLRQLGIRLIIYLDDILIMAPSCALALQHASTTPNLLEGLGFVVNYQKSVLVPATTMEFLGFVVDSLTLSLALPRDKVRKVRKECQHLIDSPLVSVQQLAKLLGHLTSTIQAVFPGPLNFRQLQSEKNRAYQQSLTYESLTPLSPQAKEELVWWRENLEAWNGKALVSSAPDLIIETDASQRGWGAFCNGVSTGGQWSQGESLLHINCLELLAWGLCRQDLCEGQNSNEGLPINGQHNCSPLHKQDGRHQVPCPRQYGSRSLGVVLTSQHPPRSAVLTGSSKYSGRPGIQSIFRPTRLEARPPDLCRTKPGLGPLTNRLVRIPSLHSTPTFFQLETRPSFRGSRCLLPRLGHCEGIRIPSFCSSRSLPEKVARRECATPCPSRTSLAVPTMVPSISRVVCSTPILFPRYQGLLTRQREAHPLVNLPLAGWLLSASHTRKQAFHNQLSPCLSQPGGMEPPSPMSLLGENGIAGVENGSLIRFRLLFYPF